MTKRNLAPVEIPSVNGEAAGQFFSLLFGWKLQHGLLMTCVMGEAGDWTGGGFPASSDENPADKLLVYICGDDIEADRI